MTSARRVERRDKTCQILILQYACILIMAFRALFFLPALPGGRPAFFTPAGAAVFALGVAALVAGAISVVWM